MIIAVLIPLVIMQVILYTRWYQTRANVEIQVNQNVARGLAALFELHINDLARQELALGTAIVSLQPDDIRHLMNTSVSLYPSVRSFHWSDADGVIIVSTDPNAVGIRLADREFYAGMVRSNSFVLSDLFTGRASGLPTFMVARAIYDGAGELRGAISASVDPAFLGPVLSGLERPEGMLMTLCDSSGAVVYINPALPSVQPGQILNDPLTREALAGREATGRFFCSLTGEEKYGVQVPVAETGWIAGASRSVDTIFAPLREPLLQSLGLLLLALVASVLLPQILASRIVRAAHSLEKHAQQIGRGDLEHPIVLSETREFSVLANAFNQMASDLKTAQTAIQQSKADLERRVEERTLELREQSRVLEAYFRHSLTPLVFLDKHFNFIRVNEAYAESCRKSVSDFPGRNHFDLYPSEELKGHFEKAIETQTPYIAFARPFVFPDDPERGVTYWDLMMVPILDDECEIDFLVFALMDVTQRHLMEEELRSASLYVRSLLEASLDPLVVISPKATITDVNKASEQATGLARNQLIGRQFVDFFAQPDLVVHGLEQVVAKGFMRDWALTLQHTSGSTIEVLCNATVYRDQSGDVQGVFIAARDVTERKRIEEELAQYRDNLEGLVRQRTAELESANHHLSREIEERKRVERELRESEARFRGLVESTSDWIWEVDAEGIYTYVSPQVEEILGYTPEEVLGQTPFDFIEPEEVQKTRDLFADLMKNRSRITALQNTNRHKDGRRVILETSGVPVIDHQGNAIGYRGVDRDITERRKAEDALRESEERFRAIVETSTDWIWAIDINGSHLYSNARIKDILGFEPNELVGKFAFDFVHPDDQDVLRQVWNKSLTAKTGWNNVVLRWCHADGSIRWVESNSVAVFDAEGRLVQFRGTDRDITQRKLAEEALRERQETLASILRVAPAGIGVIVNRMFINVNDRVCEMTGYTHEELIGANSRILYPTQEEYDFVGREKYRQIQKKGTGTVETRWRTKKGAIIEILLSSTPIDVSDLSRGVTFTALDITDRKRAQQALQKSEAQYRTLFEAATDAIMLMEELQFVECNPRALIMFGATREQVVGHTPLDFSPATQPDGRASEDKAREHIARAIAGAPQTFEWLHNRYDGTPFYSEVNLTRMELLGKVQVLAIARDITERKEAEIALRDSERNLKEAQKIARMGRWDLNLATGQLQWSEGVYEIFEIDPSQFAASYPTFLKFVHPDDRPLVDATYMESVKQHKPYEIEHRLLMPDGRIKWVNEIGRTEYDWNATPIRSMGMVQDITQRKAAEQALRESEEEFRLVFETSPVGMAMCEMDGTFVQANKAYLDIIGYSNNELMNMSYWSLTPEEYKQDEVLQLQSMAETGKYGPYEKEYIRKTGERVPVLLNGMLVTSSDGTTRIWSIVTDITERRKTEAQIQALARFPSESPSPVLRIDKRGKLLYVNPAGQPIVDLWQCQLEQTVPRQVQDKVNFVLHSAKILQMEISTQGHYYSILFTPIIEAEYVNVYGLDITERKNAENALRRTADELARSNQELEQFAYVASHDLQEPLRTVVGYLQLIERRYRDKLDSDANEFIDFVINGSTRMQTLINDLLSYSRVSTRGKEPQRVSSENALLQALSSLNATITSSQAVVTHDPLPIVLGDEMQLAQLFQNLIANAIKFASPDRIPEVHIGVRIENAHFLFWVQDNGIGVEAQYTERVFKIFQRLHTSDQYPGTGIGLAICRKIIERHGGRIWIESDFGKGTTVYFTLRHEGDTECRGNS